MLNKLFEKDELRLLWPFYLSSIIQSLTDIFVVYSIIYYLSIGLTFFQTSMIWFSMILFSVLFDIPTGAIADLFGRKVSVLLSILFTGIYFISVFFTTNFYLLLLINALWGISRTLKSGSEEAWIISNLNREKKKKLISQYYVKDNVLIEVGMTIAPLLAVLVISLFSMKYLLLFNSIGVLLSGISLLFTKEHFKKQKLHIKTLFKKSNEQTKKALKYSSEHKIIFNLILANVSFAAVAGAVVILEQPYLTSFNIDLRWIGYLASISSAVSILIPIISLKLSEKFRTSNYLLFFSLFHLVIFLIAFFTTGIWFASFIMLMWSIIYSFTYAQRSVFFQSFVPERMRATISSLRSTSGVLGNGIAALFAGITADLIGPRYAFATLPVFFLIPVIYFYAKVRTEEKTK